MVNAEEPARRRLLIVADPMCSWCWGFAPVLEAVLPRLPPDIEVGLVMGGLASDSDEPMSEEMLGYVQGAWRAVAERTGVSFNHEFWEQHHPRRSTWPACRAVLAAGDRASEMYAAIQRAYYQEARDPSDVATLVELAVELGFEPDAFRAALDAPATQSRLEADFALRDRLGASGFPSVGLQIGEEHALLTQGWVDRASLELALDGHGL